MKKIAIILSFISLSAFGQDKKISQLTPLPSVLGTELIPVARGGANYYMTPSQLPAYFGGSFIPLAGTYSASPVTGLINFNPSSNSTVLWQDYALSKTMWFGVADTKDIENTATVINAIGFGGNTTYLKGINGSYTNNLTLSPSGMQSVISDGTYHSNFGQTSSAMSLGFTNAGSSGFTISSGGNTSGSFQLQLSDLNGNIFFKTRGDKRLVYADGNQGSGKILTSDANGVATWSTPSSTTALVFNTPLSVTSGSVSIAQSNSVTAGYLSSTDWNTFNNKGSGTVTSVSALTLGTTGTDLSSTVANGTTTPVITLNVPDASASARGVITTGIQTIAGAKTFSTAPILSSLSASQILALDGSKNIQSLDVTTYPSLTELSYVKGLTSAIQTQLNSKSNIIPIFSGKQRSMPYIGVTGTAAITGTIYYYPYYVGSTHTVTAISSEVITSSAGTTINMALYSDDGTGKPGSLVEASGTISSATTGVKTYTFSTPRILLASNQVYWLAIQLTNLPSLRGTSNPVAFMYNATGQSYQQTQAYGSFPSSASSLTVGTLTYLLTLTPQ